MVTAIVHVDRKWGIGKNNDMMFSLPLDMKFFRQTTMGHTVVMGGNTLRSFPNQKPLKNRVNIVLTRGQVCDECIIVHSYEELKNELKRRENEEIFVIGGGEPCAIFGRLLFGREKPFRGDVGGMDGRQFHVAQHVGRAALVAVEARIEIAFMKHADHHGIERP